MHVHHDIFFFIIHTVVANKERLSEFILNHHSLTFDNPISVMKCHLHAASLEVEVQCFLQMQNLGHIISGEH